MKLKSSKGSITIFVLIAVLFYTAFLLLMYAANTNKIITAKEKSDILKGIYGKNTDSDSMNNLYKKLTNIESDEYVDQILYRAERLEFDGTNCFNTGIRLFNEENINKDFEISFEILDALTSGSEVEYATYMSLQSVEKPYNGFRIRNESGQLVYKGVSDSSEKTVLCAEHTYLVEGENTVKVKIKRINGVVYLCINDGDEVRICDYKNLSKPFNQPLIFGAALNDKNQPFRYSKCILGNIEVKYLNIKPTAIVNNTTNTYTHKNSITFDGTNYIDTGLKLFSPDNIDKDFEISFNVDNIGENIDKATILNAMDESSSPWPGFVVRTSGTDNIAFKANSTTENKIEKTYSKNSIHKIKIKRINSKLYFYIDDGEEIELIDHSDMANAFDTSLVFGCSMNQDGLPQRFFKGTISDISVTINSNENYNNVVYERANSITFDGTNYLDTGIKLFNEQNINKNFKIEFTIDAIDSEQVTQATILNAKDESGSPWPGICTRVSSSSGYLELSVSSKTRKSKTIQAIPGKLIIKRYNYKAYYSFNNSKYVELNDFTDIAWLFESPLVFGCSLNGSGNPQRYFKGTISNIKVAFGQ